MPFVFVHHPPLPHVGAVGPVSCEFYWASRPTWEPGWVLPPEQRRHAVLWLVLDGELEIQLPTETRTCGPGWLVATPPDLLRSAGNHTTRPATIYSLGFNLRLWGEVDLFRLYHTPGFLRIGEPERLAVPWRELLAELEACGRAVSLVAEGWARILVGRWLSDLEGAGELRPAQQVDERVETVLAALEADLARDWRLPDLADLVHLSPVRLRQVFVAGVGLPPMRYLLRRRIDLAQRLLTTTDLPAADVGRRCGFHDSSYFSRIFQKVVGLPPSGYRQRGS